MILLYVTLQPQRGVCTMPIISSPHWDEAAGICRKHSIMMLPCPECMATADPDVEARLTNADQVVLDFEPGTTVRDLLPVNCEWLAGRVRS